MSDTVDKIIFDSVVETLKQQRNVALDTVVSLASRIKQLEVQLEPLYVEKEKYKKELAELKNMMEATARSNKLSDIDSH